MKNYSKITENKDILTKEYADSTYANKSSVPAAVTESTVSGWGFTKNKGTVTSVAVKMNGATKGTVTSSGTIDLGTVITDISGLMPKSGGTFTGEVKFGSTENFQGYYIKRMLGSLGIGTRYADLDSSYKDGTYHRMWRLRFPNGSNFWGKIKITLYGGYSSFNASGVMSKSITCNFNTSSIYNNVGCYDGLGVNVEQDFRISEAIWNATASAWEVLIWQKHLNGNNSPAIMLECWTRNDTNYINAFNGIAAQTVELTQSTSYSAQKASSTGGTKTVMWEALPVYENPLGEEIATVAMLEDKQDKITSSNKLSASLVSGLATVATSGSYNDLSNKPTIPDPDNLAKLNTENTFTAKQTINSGYGAVSLKTQGYVEIGASFASKSDIGGLFGYKDDGTGRIYAVVPRDLGFVESIKMNNSSIEPDNTGIVDLGTVITDVSEKANLSGGNIFSGLQTVNAPTNSAGTEQATVKFKTANGGSITFGKEGPNSGSMIRLDQTDGTCRLRFRSSSTAGAMVWEQPEQGAKLFVDLGKSSADYHRIEFPATDGTLALTYQIPTSSTVSGWGFTKNTGTITGIKMNGSSKGTSGVVDLGTVITAHQDISGKANLSGGNTFTGKQTLNSPASDGYSIDASGYVKGSWLQAPSTGHSESGTGKICVISDNGWIYYRTPSEILTEAGGATTNQIPTVNNGTLTIQKNGTNVQTFTANQSSSVTANITVPTKASDVNALSLDGGTINKSKTVKMDASANSNGANLKWGTVNSKNPYIGYASDQTDGTFVVGSLLGTNYASGLAIGGGSGNLLWKGSKVATTSDIPNISGKVDKSAFSLSGTTLTITI